MERILLVDDELLVRTNIKLMLRNYEHEFLICGEASNGLEAIQSIPKTTPTIVISDMKMPQMDGLELCKKISSLYPEITFIALSNYDDFDFVRGTLKNGGVDYLLKHEINSKNLYHLLVTIRKKYRPTNDSSETQLNANSLNTLRKKFVLNLLSNMFTSDKDIINSITVLDIKLDPKKIIPIILTIDNYNQTLKKQDMKRQSIIEFSIVNICNEILSNYETGMLTHIEGGEYCLLLSFARVPSDAKITELINSIIQQLFSNLQNYLNISSSYCIGSICHSLHDVSSSYASAKAALHSKFHLGNHSILYAKDALTDEMTLCSLDKQYESELFSYTSIGDNNKIEYILNLIFNDILERKLNIASAQMIFTDLIGIVSKISKEKDISLNTLFSNNAQPNELLTQFNTLVEIKKWFTEIFKILCHEINLQFPADSEYIRKAISYINANFSQPISQQTVADAIGISCGYLSTTFKSETGQGFSEYLNSLRISMAEKLITSSDLDMRIIASKCGFQEYSYFFKVFKKRVGMTPKEYAGRFH